MPDFETVSAILPLRQSFEAPVMHDGSKSYRAICLPQRNVRASEAEKNREGRRTQTKSPSSSFEREMSTVPAPNVRVQFRVLRISIEMSQMRLLVSFEF